MILKKYRILGEGSSDDCVELEVMGHELHVLPDDGLMVVRVDDGGRVTAIVAALRGPGMVVEDAAMVKDDDDE